jgi:hypothetical protein
VDTCALPLELETLLVEDVEELELVAVVDVVEVSVVKVSVVELPVVEPVVEPVASSEAVDETAATELEPEPVPPLYEAAASQPNPAEAATPAMAVPMVRARRRRVARDRSA